MRVQDLIVGQIQFHANMIIPRAFHFSCGKSTGHLLKNFLNEAS